LAVDVRTSKQADPTPPATAVPPSQRMWLRRAAPALGAYVVIRAVCVLALVAWSQYSGKSARVLLSQRWDSLWYMRVAEYGYDYVLQAPDGRSLSNMAFFPLLPWLEEVVSTLTGLGLTDAGLLVSACASVGAAGALFAIGDYLYGSRTGTLLVVLWASLPVGIVQSMAYSESLFVLVSGWSLYFVLRGNWLAAGILATLAGLTRPVGLAVAAAIAVAAICSYAYSSSESRQYRSREIVSAVLGCIIAPLGAVGYILWVGYQKGDLFGYLDVQDEWGNGFDGGLAFAQFTLAQATSSPYIGGIGLAAGAALVAWACYLCLRLRLPVSLLVYTAVIVLLAMGASGYFGSKPRFLMPAFPLLLPLALRLGRMRSTLRYCILTILVVAAAVYGAVWLNGSGPP
jgi:hypothetical protein